ncbi:MAG: hypothetical protein WDA68_09140 [Phycisphaerae bacterium]
MNNLSSECLDLFLDEYKKSGELGDLRNHNLVLMDIGEWQKAKSNCIKIIDKEEHSGDSDFIDLGLTKWFMGDYKNAIEFWKRSLETEYTVDPVGPINGLLVLWYAGQQISDEKLVDKSLKKLKQYWKVHDYRVFNEWPGTIAIAGFLLDKVPTNTFLHEWKDMGGGSLEHQRLCRVNFWVGMKCLEEGNESTATAYFRSAFYNSKRAIQKYEYFLAKWEYSRLTGKILWPEYGK